MKYDNIEKSEFMNFLEKMPLACVDLVIAHEGKILLIKRTQNPAKGEWWTPGGRIFKNEKAEDAAKRKALEETGLKVKIVKPLGFFQYFSNTGYFREVESGAHCITCAFLVEPEGEVKVNLDETSGSFKWIIKIDEELHPMVKKELKDSGVFSDAS